MTDGHTDRRTHGHTDIHLPPLDKRYSPIISSICGPNKGNGLLGRKGIRGRGIISRKKNANDTNAIPNLNLLSSKSDNRKALKNSGNGLKKKGIKKKCKCHKCHPKMNLCRKFHPNRTKGKCSKNRGNGIGGRGEFRRGEGGGEFRKKYANVTNAIL